MDTVAKLDRVVGGALTGIFMCLMAVGLVNYIFHTTPEEFLQDMQDAWVMNVEFYAKAAYGLGLIVYYFAQAATNGDDPMRTCAVWICVAPFLLSKYPAVWWWFCRVSMAILVAGGLYLFLLAARKDEIDSQISRQYLWCVIVPAVIISSWDVVIRRPSARIVYMQRGESPSS